MSAVEGLLSKLTGCACSPSRRHVVTIHHGDGSVDQHIVNGPVIDENNLNKWRLFPHAVSPYSKLSFNDLRLEANRTLKYFIAENVPFPKPDSKCICSIPDFWLTSVKVDSLPLSCRPIQIYHGAVATIRLQDILPWGQVQPLRSNMGDKVRLATRHKQKSYMTAIVELARSIIGRCSMGGHIELPEVNMDTMKQADALLQDWSDEEQEEDEQEPRLEEEGGQELEPWQEQESELEQEPRQEQESRLELEPRQEQDLIQEQELRQEEDPRKEQDLRKEQDTRQEQETMQEQVSRQEQEPRQEQEWPLTQAAVQYIATDAPNLTRGLTSSYVRPVLADFFLDSSLNLPLMSSYYQVVQCKGQDVSLSDGSTVVLAKLSPSLLETLADIRLLYSVIAVHEATGHPAQGDLVLVSFSSLVLKIYL